MRRSVLIVGLVVALLAAAWYFDLLGRARAWLSAAAAPSGAPPPADGGNLDLESGSGGGVDASDIGSAPPRADPDPTHGTGFVVPRPANPVSKLRPSARPVPLGLKQPQPRRPAVAVPTAATKPRLTTAPTTRPRFPAPAPAKPAPRRPPY